MAGAENFAAALTTHYACVRLTSNPQASAPMWTTPSDASNKYKMTKANYDHSGTTWANDGAVGPAVGTNVMHYSGGRLSEYNNSGLKRWYMLRGAGHTDGLFSGAQGLDIDAMCQAWVDNSHAANYDWIGLYTSAMYAAEAGGKPAWSNESAGNTYYYWEDSEGNKKPGAVHTGHGGTIPIPNSSKVVLGGYAMAVGANGEIGFYWDYDYVTNTVTWGDTADHVGYGNIFGSGHPTIGSGIGAPDGNVYWVTSDNDDFQSHLYRLDLSGTPTNKFIGSDYDSGGNMRARGECKPLVIPDPRVGHEGEYILWYMAYRGIADKDFGIYADFMNYSVYPDVSNFGVVTKHNFTNFPLASYTGGDFTYDEDNNRIWYCFINEDGMELMYCDVVADFDAWTWVDVTSSLSFPDPSAGDEPPTYTTSSHSEFTSVDKAVGVPVLFVIGGNDGHMRGIRIPSTSDGGGGGGGLAGKLVGGGLVESNLIGGGLV